MDITEKEMNRNAVKNAVKTDITDEERLADLFGDCITDSEKLKKVRDVLWEINNSGYCDSMAWELSTDSPSAQARYWQMNAERRDVLEREFDRLTQIVETYIGERMKTICRTAAEQNTFRTEDVTKANGGTAFAAGSERCIAQTAKWFTAASGRTTDIGERVFSLIIAAYARRGHLRSETLIRTAMPLCCFRTDGGLNAFSKRKRIAAGRAAGCAVIQTGTHCSATGTACIIPKAGAFTPLLKAERLKDTGKKAAKTVLLNILRRTERRRNAAIGTTRNRAFHKSEKKRGKRIETRA